MKELTPEELIDNWDLLIKTIEDKISEPRRENLLCLYSDLQDRILYCPASYKDYFHSAYPGGYVTHVLNVLNNAIILDELWIKNGATKNYTDEELIFVAINHDLGKIGDRNDPYYIEHDERWRKSRGEVYMINPEIRYMQIPDRTIYLLNHYGVILTQTENLAILLHDGMYDEGNESYLKGYSEYKQLDDNLPIIIHHADMMATYIERDKWRASKTKKRSTKSTKKDKKTKPDAIDKAAKDFFKKG